MSTLTRKGSRSIFPDLFDWLEPPYALLRPFTGQAMRIEEGIEGGRFVVHAELPGIEADKQAKVTVLNGVLTIEAERSESAENHSHSEFHYGTFTRRLALPENANEKDIEASYDKGILEVTVGLETKNAVDHAERAIPIRVIEHIKPT
jgi:HSP20 family protein